MEPICLFPVSGIILRTCFRLFADSDVAFVFLADKLARFCHHIGKALPKAWQNFANMVAKRWQSNLLACEYMLIAILFCVDGSVFKQYSFFKTFQD